MTNLNFELKDLGNKPIYFHFLYTNDAPNMYQICINNNTIAISAEQVLFLSKQLTNLVELAENSITPERAIEKAIKDIFPAIET